MIIPSIFNMLHKVYERKHFLCQIVKLIGLNTLSFQTYMENFQYIHTSFSHHILKGALEHFQPFEFLNYPFINIATHHFTLKCKNPNGTAVPFLANVNLKGILHSLAIDNYFHGLDNNIVSYNITKANTGTQFT